MKVVRGSENSEVYQKDIVIGDFRLLSNGREQGLCAVSDKSWGDKPGRSGISLTGLSPESTPM